MKNGHTIIFLIAALIGCTKAEDKIEPKNPNPDALADYHAVAESIAADFTIGGFGVISRKLDGSPEHMGEALIWGGTYLWSAPCEAGQAISDSLRAMIESNDGAMIRVDPLGEYAGGREVTFDGAIGALLGISRRVTDCDEQELWKYPIEKMIAFQNSHGDRLHANVDSKLFGEFKYVRDLIAYQVGLRGEPDSDRLRDMEKIVGAWAFAVQLAHNTGQGSDACYRVNLGLTSLLAAETLGKSISGSGRDQFCQNTKEMDIPTVDHWCGRRNIETYIWSYQVNKWEYRHQRCAWESPDGKSNTSPKLDKLIAYVFTNGWQLLQN